MSGYLLSAIERTKFDDHGLVVWHSGNTGPLVNEAGGPVLEAVLLWKAVPDPGQEDSEYPSGKLSFKRRNIDADFSEPVHVQNMWRAAERLGIGYNWEHTAKECPEAAAWLRGGSLPDLGGSLPDPPAAVTRSGITRPRFSYRQLLRKHAVARKEKREQLLRWIGQEWTIERGFVCCGDVRIRVIGYPPWIRYVAHVSGARAVMRSVKDLITVLRRLGLPVKER